MLVGLSHHPWDPEGLWGTPTEVTAQGTHQGPQVPQRGMCWLHHLAWGLPTPPNPHLPFSPGQLEGIFPKFQSDQMTQQGLDQGESSEVLREQN